MDVHDEELQEVRAARKKGGAASCLYTCVDEAVLKEA